MICGQEPQVRDIILLIMEVFHSDPSENPMNDRVGIKRMGNCGNDGGQVGRLRELVRNIAGLREVSSKDSLHRLVPCRD